MKCTRVFSSTVTMSMCVSHDHDDMQCVLCELILLTFNHSSTTVELIHLISTQSD